MLKNSPRCFIGSPKDAPKGSPQDVSKGSHKGSHRGPTRCFIGALQDASKGTAPAPASVTYSISRTFESCFWTNQFLFIKVKLELKNDGCVTFYILIVSFFSLELEPGAGAAKMERPGAEAVTRVILVQAIV